MKNLGPGETLAKDTLRKCILATLTSPPTSKVFKKWKNYLNKKENAHLRGVITVGEPFFKLSLPVPDSVQRAHH